MWNWLSSPYQDMKTSSWIGLLATRRVLVMGQILCRVGWRRGCEVGFAESTDGVIVHRQAIYLHCSSDRLEAVCRSWAVSALGQAPTYNTLSAAEYHRVMPFLTTAVPRAVQIIPLPQCLKLRFDLRTLPDAHDKYSACASTGSPKHNFRTSS